MTLKALFLTLGSAVAFDLGVYAGGCVLAGGSVYYAGGSLEEGETKLNPYTLALNFSKGIELDSGNAPWETINTSQKGSFIQTKYPGVVFFDDSNSIVMYGGKGVNQDQSFQIFDLALKMWKVENNSEKSWNATIGTDSAYESTPYQFTLTKNDNKVKNFIMFGGISSTQGSKVPNNIVRNLNSVGPSWSTITGVEQKIYGHSAAVFRGTLFIIGGVDATTGSLIPMKNIPRFDVAAGLWNNAQTQGDIPESRTLHSSVQYNNIVYIAGGSAKPDSLEVISDYIYTLDLNTLTWKKIEVKGFQGSVSGCLSYYNGILLSSFGYREQPTSKTYLIDTNSWSSIKKSPPGGLSDAKGSSGTSLGLIIGSILGGIAFIGLVLACLGCLLIKRRKQKEAKEIENELRPPELLQGFVWSNNNNDSTPMVFLAETHIPNFESEITRPGPQTATPSDLTNSGSPLVT